MVLPGVTAASILGVVSGGDPWRLLRPISARKSGEEGRETYWRIRRPSPPLIMTARWWPRGRRTSRLARSAWGRERKLRHWER